MELREVVYCLKPMPYYICVHYRYPTEESGEDRVQRSVWCSDLSKAMIGDLETIPKMAPDPVLYDYTPRVERQIIRKRPYLTAFSSRKHGRRTQIEKVA